MTDKTMIIEATPSPMPRTERIVIKLKKREFFFDFKYRTPIQPVHELDQR
jgi:hypothetical protein